MENPGSSRQEKSIEQFPTKQEVLAFLFEIDKDCERATIKRELRDEDGLYLLEVEKKDAVPGDTTEYIYQRKGTRPDGSVRNHTNINVTYLENGMPVSGTSVAEFNETTKTWKKCE